MRPTNILALSLVHVALCAIVFFGAQPARACEPHCDLKLVGFDKKGSALVRRECGDGGIDLVIVELASGRETHKISIIDTSDPGETREQLRSKRWKQAEAALEESGFTIDAQYPRLDGDKLALDGLVILKEAIPDDEVGWGGVKFVAKKGDASVVLFPPIIISISDRPSYQGFYLSPDKRHLVLLENSCVPKVRVFDVAKLNAALGPVPDRR